MASEHPADEALDRRLALLRQGAAVAAISDGAWEAGLRFAVSADAPRRPTARRLSWLRLAAAAAAVLTVGLPMSMGRPYPERPAPALGVERPLRGPY